MFTDKEKLTWPQRIVTVIAMLIGAWLLTVLAPSLAGVKSHHCPAAFPVYQPGSAGVPALCVSATNSAEYVAAP